MTTTASGANGAYNVTLAASTVDTVTPPTGRVAHHVEVVNVNGTSAIYFTVDNSTPLVGGGGTEYEIPAGALIARTVEVSGLPTVKLISAGTPTYSVTYL